MSHSACQLHSNTYYTLLASGAHSLCARSGVRMYYSCKTQAMGGGTSGNISVVIGDLLASGSHIAHCISADIRMSKGVALEVRNKFGGVDLLKSQNLGVGNVGVTTYGHNSDGDPVFIFHLVHNPYLVTVFILILTICILILYSVICICNCSRLLNVENSITEYKALCTYFPYFHFSMIVRKNQRNEGC